MLLSLSPHLICVSKNFIYFNTVLTQRGIGDYGGSLCGLRALNICEWKVSGLRGSWAAVPEQIWRRNTGVDKRAAPAPLGDIWFLSSLEPRWSRFKCRVTGGYQCPWGTSILRGQYWHSKYDHPIRHVISDNDARYSTGACSKSLCPATSRRSSRLRMRARMMGRWGR